MDDRIGKEKSTDLFRSILLDHWRYWIGLCLIVLVASTANASIDTTSIDSSQKYPCDTTLKGKQKCAEWYENGELHIVKNYKNGVPHGVWWYYKESGELDKTVRYRKGKIINQLYYKEDKVYKTIDKKGRVKYLMDCDCL